MKKRGFTLIELLAVIVILAIIALIATPIVMNVIENSRKGAAERSTENYLHAVEVAIMEEKINNKDFNPSICIIENKTTTNCDGVLLTINMNGKEVSGGYIKIQDGKITNYNVIVDGEEITTDKVVVTAEEETPAECFNVTENYNYTINEATCKSFFEGQGADSESATMLCSEEHGDLINLSNVLLGISKEVLVNAGVISNLEEKGTLSISGYTCGGENGTHRDVVVPKEIDGKKVTEIGANAFSDNQLTSVVIPNGVTTIGLNAFYNNQLTSVVIPNSVTEIGEFAFSINQLTNVVIPNGVTTIGLNVFFDNQLTSVVIPNSVTEIGEFAFSNNQLTNVVIPNSVTKIGHDAFSNNQLTSVVIPNSVTEIGEFAFSNNQLTSVVISNNIKTIYGYTFNHNNLTSVVIPNNVTEIEVFAFGHNLLEEVKIKNTKGNVNLGDSAFGTFDTNKIKWVGNN